MTILDRKLMPVSPEPDNVNEPGRVLLVDWIWMLWRRKTLGVVICVLSLGVAITYLHVATYQYSAVLTVTPADQNAPKTSDGIASIGSLVGVNVSGQSTSAFSLYAEAVTSYSVAEQVSHDSMLMRAVFSKSWDSQRNIWRQPSLSLPSRLSKIVQELIGIPVQAWHPPGPYDLQEYIEKNIVVAESKKKNLIQISYRNKDPVVAERMLIHINTAADSFLRQRALARAVVYIDYLEKRLTQVGVADYRISILQTLSTYEKTRMMASANTSFAAENFGNVWISPTFASPKPLIIILLAFALAFVGWVVLVIVILPAFTSITKDIKRLS